MNLSFTVIDKKIDFVNVLENFLYKNKDDGSNIFFFGKIRDNNFNKKVLAINYDICEALALKSVKSICNEIFVKYKYNVEISIYHRKGIVKSGEVGILIMVKSSHREESFIICKYLIEQIKKRSTIWKKEYYSDGSNAWIRGYSLCQFN